ncbi:MAG: hypothetical protein JWQ81_1654 [Amycolatopsis sp.]|jgi:hypothetical protein|uniref:hypothetical protein n=1 Tax=Amycolatopsis sp. TaxID=37632 RepID=UPI002630A974|nr:hypothetical protein [Amycolatopsis sp.]MCU1680915.1 hypothetical protein [Amycolatopsis sp.]
MTATAFLTAPAIATVSVPKATHVAVPRWARSTYLRAVVLYLAVRALGIGVLAVMASRAHLPLLDRLTAWDGQWYLNLAQAGYGMTGTIDATGKPFADAPMAFFPLYPSLISLVHNLPGVSLTAAGIVVSTLAGTAAACALLRIGRLVSPGSTRTGLILVALWAGAPMAITESMVYTEALFTALAAWALVGVLERNWYLAGAACLFAGLTRSTAVVIIAVVLIAALIAFYRDLARWPALAAAVAAPLGLVAYWGSVAIRTGSLTGWQDIEMRGWNTRWDFGREAWLFIKGNLFGDGPTFEVVVVAVVLGAIVLAGLSVRRLPWPLAAYAVGVVLLVVGTAGLPFAKSRFLLPDFPLLIPIAIGLAKCRTSTAMWATVAFVLAGSWFSAYSLTVWRYAI